MVAKGDRVMLGQRRNRRETRRYTNSHTWPGKGMMLGRRKVRSVRNEESKYSEMTMVKGDRMMLGKKSQRKMKTKEYINTTIVWKRK